MPQTLNELLRDRFLRHQERVVRLANLIDREATRELTRLRDDLTAAMADRPFGLQRNVKRTIAGLFQVADLLISHAYDEITQFSVGQWEQLGATEAEGARLMLNRAIGVKVARTKVPRAVSLALSRDDLFGAPARSWWAEQSNTLQRRFRTQIRMGINEGESIAEMTRRIRGTREGNFKDGIMNASRHQAETLVRTGTLYVSNSARLAVFQANPIVVKGVVAMVTLDEKTTTFCIAHSGAAWDIKTGKPLPESTIKRPFFGPPPWHWNCRTVLMPIVRSLDDVLAAAGKHGQLPDSVVDSLGRLRSSPAMQASMNGAVPADMTYSDWLRTQPKTFQNKVLGEDTAKRWRAGKLALNRLDVERQAPPMTMGQFRRAIFGRTRAQRVEREMRRVGAAVA